MSGLGGVGKTQIAIEYVLQYKTDYNGVFWISAANRLELLSGFQKIAETVGCPISDNKDPESVANDVLIWLNQKQSWLLVLDNLDDIFVVQDCLPDSSSVGHVLITSRDPNSTGIPAQALKVDVFSKEEATELLLLRADLADNTCDRVESEADKIVIELGCLALAIEQAAAYIRERLKDIFKFLAVYKEHRKFILAKRPRQIWGYPKEVATTWLLSFAAIKEMNSNSALLLNLFAFLNPDEILVEFLKAGSESLPQPLKTVISDAVEFSEALGDLEQFSLISRSNDGEMISIHRLVQAVLKDNLEPEDRLKLMEMVVELLISAFPMFEEGNRRKCRHFQFQVIGPLLSLVEFGYETTNVAAILLRVGIFLYAEGKFLDGERLQDKAVGINTAIFGCEDVRTLTARNNLAETYGALGRTKDAAALHEKVLEVRQRTLGDEHPDTLTSMNNLAETYGALGRTKDAAALHEKVLEVSTKDVG